MSNKKGRKWDGTSRVKFLLWLMGLAGGISSWAWREHVKILKRIQDIEHKKLIDGSDLINEMDFNNQQKGEGRWK